MAGRFCVRYKRTSGGRRCAEYAGGSFGGYGDWADLGLGGGYGDIGLTLDSGLAPVSGGGPALLTAVLLRMYASQDSWFYRNAGWTGAGAGIVTSILYGLARGWGSAVVGGVTALAAGGAVEAIGAATGYRIKKNLEQAGTPPASAAPAAEKAGLGYIRARQLRGYGRAAAFLPAVGTSPLDVLRSNAGVAVY